MKVLVQGAGIGGCYIAAALSQEGFDVTVVEKRSWLFTKGAGIVLYSNALKCIDYISLLDQILKAGCPLAGQTEIWDRHSKLLGIVNYSTIDNRYPSYVGINRSNFQKILYNRAVENKVKFLFGHSIEIDSLTGYSNTPIQLSDGTVEHFDLVVAADGTNSLIRKHIFQNQESKFTFYGLWHSLHKRRKEVNEKITVIGDGCRLGFVPLDNEHMYVWASAPEPEKIKIPRDQHYTAMKQKFTGKFTGLVKEVVDELDDSSYVNFTAVEEVHLPKPWYKGNIVFIGDSAHASLPFMAQGGAQALQDAATLTQLLADNNLDDALKQYTDFRYDVAKYVQTTSNRIGQNYRAGDAFDLQKAQEGADAFYLNLDNFKLPKDLK